MSQAHRLYRTQSLPLAQLPNNPTPTQTASLTLQTAMQGNVEAQALLGQILLDGHGIQKDPSLALQWFQIAARQNHAMAANMAGRCFEHGWGHEIDCSQAVHYYQQAAHMGLDWGLYNLANLYATGRGVLPNDPKAFQLYWQAAHKGHAKSMNLVGRYLEEGRIGSADPQSAHRWYQRSAEAGDFRGQFSWAAVLIAQQRWSEALFWLEQARRLGHAKFLRHAHSELEKAQLLPLAEMTLAYQNRLLELDSAADA